MTNKLKVSEVPNLYELCRTILLENVKHLELVEYEAKYQNQVMTLGIRILSDDVDEVNRVIELEYLSKAFKKNLYESYILNTDRNLWVLKNYDMVYGYIAIVTYNSSAILNGLYIDPLFRGSKTGLANRMLEKAEDFAKNKGCTVLNAEVAHYSKRAINFYEKNGFVHIKTEKENDEQLVIYHYQKRLNDNK